MSMFYMYEAIFVKGLLMQARAKRRIKEYMQICQITSRPAPDMKVTIHYITHYVECINKYY